MAKKVGADAPDPKLSTGAPGPDHNQVMTEGKFLRAVQEIGAARLKVKHANESLKTLRGHWKANGIALTALDHAVEMADWNRGEIRDAFDTERQYALWLGLPVGGAQQEFKGLTDDQIQRKEWFAAGRTASRTGKPPRPNDEVPPEYHQVWMQGFNEEDEAAWSESETVSEQVEPSKLFAAFPDDVAAWSDAQHAEFEAWFASLGGKFDDVFVSHVGARKEFQRLMAGHTPKPGESDHPDTVAKSADHNQPDWSKYDDDPENWFVDQKRTFREWFDALPAQAVVRISHLGVLAAFRAARAEELAAGGEQADDAPSLAEGDEEPVPGEVAPKAKGGKTKAGQTVQ